MNTFQAILATNGNQTFVMFLYEDIQWANFVTSIGFNAGDREESITLPESLTTEGVLNLENTTNVGIPGVYIFRVDQPMPGKVKKITTIPMVARIRASNGVLRVHCNLHC